MSRKRILRLEFDPLVVNHLTDEGLKQIVNTALSEAFDSTDFNIVKQPARKKPNGRHAPG